MQWVHIIVIALAILRRRTNAQADQAAADENVTANDGQEVSASDFKPDG